jgi:sugar lactone lactonase YvrE
MPSHIAVDGSAVYVTEVDINDENEAADVVRIPLDGGPRTILAAAQRAGQSIVITPAAVFYVTGGDVDRKIPDSVVRVPTSGGKPVKVGKTFLFADAGLATDGDSLYFGELRDKANRVMRLPIAGGKATELASTVNDAVRLFAVDGLHVYWLASSKILKVAKSGGTASELAQGTNVWGMASNGAHLYWTDKGDGKANGTVRRVPVAGGPVETLASGLTLPWGIAVDSTHAYWVTNADKTGSVMRVPTRGGPPETLAAQQDAPVHIALDAGSVYWTNAGSGTVLRMPK